MVDAATNTVATTIPVGRYPFGVAVSPDGSKVYVTNGGSATVSVIATASNAVTATVPVGSAPVAFGSFALSDQRQNLPAPPARRTCHGQSVSALARKYGGLNGAAAALDYPSVSALLNAIMAFCGG